MTQKEIDLFFEEQLESWPDCKTRFDQLENLELKKFQFNGFSIILQHNPARAISTEAKVDEKSIAKRPCFLCKKNRPEQQKTYEIIPGFDLLVNPYPILRKHFTIASTEHKPQEIMTVIDDMLEISKEMPSYTVFYNGPECGASAPDHLHFQAVKSGQMPFESEYSSHENIVLSENKFGSICQLTNYGRKLIIMDADNIETIRSFFKQIYTQLSFLSEKEPKMNLFSKFENGRYTLFLFPRKEHRPKQYFEAVDNILISPGAIDMGGVIVAPRKTDFLSLNEDTILDIYKQVSL